MTEIITIEAHNRVVDRVTRQSYDTGRAEGQAFARRYNDYAHSRGLFVGCVIGLLAGVAVMLLVFGSGAVL